MLAFFSTVKDVAPWVAMGLSIAALWISILNYRRDKADLRAWSEYSLDWEGFHACLRVNIVNAGRRPIILSSWAGGELKTGRLRHKKLVNWYGTFFEPKNSLTLTERQTYSFQLEADEIIDVLPDGDVIEFHDLWIKDTLGHRYMVKDARKNLEKLRQWKAKQSTAHKTGS
ncbi:hypothetical protein [Duganella callida]|uniref:Uncharacterized protein n=1 Tax=Duganella callida TaxID=2561932 RepID=A0A4Y9S891_9BURK|nr:hypothetical protein [Duganella callida]TFW17555.1 hypothetical protein E4L98_20335 [Duganella callida]